MGLSRDGLVEKATVEVGNIFTLGTRFSEPLNLYYTNEQGQQQPVFMGSYGIGPSRLVGLLAEHFADEHGLVWPLQVAPFHVYLASLGDEPDVKKAADELYDKLQDTGLSVIYDDRDERPGQKFADADLMGIPYRVVVSQKSLAGSGFELKSRTQTDTQTLPQEKLLETLTTTRQA